MATLELDAQCAVGRRSVVDRGLDGLGARYTGHRRRIDTEGKKLTLQIPAPTRRLYANEMVDRPYTGFGITDDAQSHIVPTLIRQTQ
jgi:hypothetical protein